MRINHNREQGFLVGPNMHDSLAVAGFLDPSLLTLKEYYVDVETTGELTAGETLGYSPSAGDLKRKPGAENRDMNMSIRGSAPTLASTRTSPVLRDKFVPNAKVAVDVDSAAILRSADWPPIGNVVATCLTVRMSPPDQRDEVRQ